ncbi:MAG: nucleotidyltransferase family protein [Candidatus Aminicenantes bacterium]|nr:nucleotidyltransferase family protein [Candidatus Aminicenantes bacterium]
MARVREVFINLHHLPEKIRGYFEDGRKWGVKIQYSYEHKILGTAGAVKKLEKELGAEPFLVIYGDNFIEIDYRDFIEYSESRDGIGTVVVFEKEDVSECGILDISDDMLVRRFKEKPKKHEVFSHWVSAGVFYFRKEIFEYVESGSSDFGFDVLPRILESNGKIYAFKLKSDVWGIDEPDLIKALESRISHTENRISETGKRKS